MNYIFVIFFLVFSVFLGCATGPSPVPVQKEISKQERPPLVKKETFSPPKKVVIPNEAPLENEKKEDAISIISQKIIEKIGDAGKNIAIVEFSELKGVEYVTSAKGKLVSERLITNLVNSDYVTVIERGQLQKVLDELKLNMQGVIDSSSAKEVGKILGIEALVTGTIIELKSVSEINARMIDTESGKIMAAVTVQQRIELPENLKAQPPMAKEEIFEPQQREDQRDHRPFPPPRRRRQHDSPKPFEWSRERPRHRPLMERGDRRRGDFSKRSDRRRAERDFGDRHARLNNDSENDFSLRERFEGLMNKKAYPRLLEMAEEEYQLNPNSLIVRFYLGAALSEIGHRRGKEKFFHMAKKHLRFVIESDQRRPQMKKRLL